MNLNNPIIITNNNQLYKVTQLKKLSPEFKSQYKSYMKSQASTENMANDKKK